MTDYLLCSKTGLMCKFRSLIKLDRLVSSLIRHENMGDTAQREDKKGRMRNTEEGRRGGKALRFRGKTAHTLKYIFFLHNKRPPNRHNSHQYFPFCLFTKFTSNIKISLEGTTPKIRRLEFLFFPLFLR